MIISFSPLMFVTAAVIGSISAYLAYRRGRNPYAWFAIGFFFGIFGIFAIFFVPGPKKKPVRPAPKTIYTIQGPIDKFWYFLDPANQQHGPMSRDALAAAFKEGKIDDSTFIWHEELSDWQPLKEIIKQELVH